MKKIFAFAMILSLGTLSMTSCKSSKQSTGVLGSGATGTIVKTVATVVGVIVLSKIINSVLGKITGSTAFSSLAQNQGFINNFNENTKLSSFANNEVLKAGLQLLVSQHYQIPFATVSNNYNSLNTVGDLATFIGKNASAKALNELK